MAAGCCANVKKTPDLDNQASFAVPARGGFYSARVRGWRSLEVDRDEEARW